MRLIHTLVCAAAVLFAGSVSAQENADIHPVIGAKPPKELKASDIMALPDAERQAWIHGAVSLALQVTFAHDTDQANCMVQWYFGSGNGQETVPLALKSYPDERASAIVIAILRNSCPDE